ncbi:MAG: InlB B-repeat-containing protein, partial [Clostridiales bacterium]|nr:InlB B-repeat-containing protein [Clostridiales bacterium]
MKKMRWLLSIVMAFVMVLGVSLLAVGCADDDDEPNTPPPAPTTYTVTYEKGEGEDGTAPEVKSYEEGASVTLAAATTFTKEGHTFEKWLEGTNEYDAGATFTMPAKNVTFKAKWKENAPVVDKGDATELKIGDTLIILGESDKDETEGLSREVTFKGTAGTIYTMKLTLPEFEDEYTISDFTVFGADYPSGEPLLDGNTTEYVFKMPAEGQITFTVAGMMYYVADDYDAELEKGTLNVKEGGELVWEVVFYKDLSLLGHGFVPALGTESVSDGEKLAEDKFPEQPTNIGFIFGGWFIVE